MKKILTSGLIAGIVLFILSYGGLYLAIRFFPELFFEYNNPLFSGDGSRDILFYSHAFIIAMALSFCWSRFKGLFRGNFLLRGLEFGFLYGLIALLPVMWISFSALDVSILTVVSWFLYGLAQALFAGVLFARINP